MSSVPPPRIYRLTYKGSASPRGERGRFIARVACAYIKVPYGGLFGLSDTLDRALTTRQIAWYRLELANTITPEIRAGLVRWGEALQTTSAVTGVRWDQ